MTIGVGAFRARSDGQRRRRSNGTLFYVNGSHAQVGQRPLGLQGLCRRLLAGSAGAPDRRDLPSGTGPYPAFANEGTTQPKVDVRADYDFEDGQRKLVFQGGVAGTDGILHSGIGPFDIDSGTVLGYGKVNYSKGAMKLNFFTNILNGDATNLLAVGLNGQPLNFVFKSNTYDFEFGDVRTFQAAPRA